MSFLESWWDKFLANPERNATIMGFIFLIQVLPIVYPLGLPIKYSPYTKDLAAMVEGSASTGWTTSYGRDLEGVQPGDIFVWGEVCEHAGGYSADRDWWATIIMLFMEKDAKIICAAFGYPSVGIFSDLFNRYIKPNYPEKQYGVDYVFTEFLPGREAAIRYFAENIWDVTDYRGTPFKDLPLIRDSNVRTFADVDYSCGTVCRTTDHDMFIRQWAVQYEQYQDFFLRGNIQTGAAYYGGAITAVTQYAFETEHWAGTFYGKPHFFGEELIKIECRELGAILYIPLIIWGLYVNWKRQLSEGVSLEPRVGERGQ